MEEAGGEKAETVAMMASRRTRNERMMVCRRTEEVSGESVDGESHTYYLVIFPLKRTTTCALDEEES